MKKLVVLIALLALVPVFVPAQAHSTLTLAQRVTRLENKMACIKKIPAGRFSDFAWFGITDPRPPANQQPDFSGFDSTDPSTWPSDPLINWGGITGIDFTYPASSTEQVWMLGIVNSSTCRGRFATLADPGVARVAARSTQAMRLAQLRRAQ